MQFHVATQRSNWSVKWNCHGVSLRISISEKVKSTGVSPLSASIRPLKWKQPPSLRWKYRISSRTMKSLSCSCYTLVCWCMFSNLEDIWSTAWWIIYTVYSAATPSHVPCSWCLGAMRCSLWYGGAPSHPPPAHMVDRPCPQGVGRLVLFIATLSPSSSPPDTARPRGLTVFCPASEEAFSAPI